MRYSLFTPAPRLVVFSTIGGCATSRREVRHD